MHLRQLFIALKCALAAYFSDASLAFGQESDDRDSMIIAIGAAGSDEFEGEFESW